MTECESLRRGAGRGGAGKVDEAVLNAAGCVPK